MDRIPKEWAVEQDKIADPDGWAATAGLERSGSSGPAHAAHQTCEVNNFSFRLKMKYSKTLNNVGQSKLLKAEQEGPEAAAALQSM